MTDSWAVFGYGYFGQVHARELTAHAEVDAIADPFASDLPDNVQRIDEFVTNRVTIDRNADGSIAAHDYDPLPDDHPLRAVDGWDIVAPTPTHLDLMIAGLEEGKQVFVEKPPAETVAELDYVLETFPNAHVGVDYIELCHPVVLAIQDALRRDDITPEYAFHWRAKDLRDEHRAFGSGEGSRIILDDLVHDITELDAFARASGLAPLTETATVTDASIQRWSALDPPRPYETDVTAQFTVDLDNGFTADVRGSFAEPERRYFVITNGDDWAAFGSTLTRDYIDPVAAVVTGADNVDELVDAAKNESITTSTAINALLTRLNAERLTQEVESYVPSEKWRTQPHIGLTPLHRMFDAVISAETPDDLPCSLAQAREYQAIAEAVYEAADAEDAMNAPTNTIA